MSQIFDSIRTNIADELNDHLCFVNKWSLSAPVPNAEQWFICQLTISTPSGTKSFNIRYKENQIQINTFADTWMSLAFDDYRIKYLWMAILSWQQYKNQ